MCKLIYAIHEHSLLRFDRVRGTFPIFGEFELPDEPFLDLLGQKKRRYEGGDTVWRLAARLDRSEKGPVFPFVSIALRRETSFVTLPQDAAASPSSSIVKVVPGAWKT